MTLNMNELARGGTLCLNQAVFTEATTTAGAIQNDAGSGLAYINFAINGILYVYPDTDDVVITAAAQQADLTTCLYLICLSTASALTTVKGVEVLTVDITSGKEVLRFPAPLANTCPIGAMKIVLSGGTFTAATTDLSGAGVTATFLNLMAVPTGPITS